MAYPAHYFVKYLILTLPDLSWEGVNGALVLHGMGEISKPDYAAACKEAVPPEGFRPWDKSDRKSTRWLREQRVHSLFFPDAATKEMVDLVRYHPRLRAEVEQLILGNVPAREAAFRLKKAGKAISEGGYQEYQHYFWNTAHMGLEDWTAYFKSTKEERTGAHLDAYKAAMAVGPELALYRLGVPVEVDSQRMLQEVLQELYFTFLEIKSLPLSETKVMMLTRVAKGITQVDAQLQSKSAALSNVLKKFEKFKLRTEPAKIPSLFDLAPTGSVSQKDREEIVASQETAS
jgi:hypothetical protein